MVYLATNKNNTDTIRCYIRIFLITNHDRRTWKVSQKEEMFNTTSCTYIHTICMYVSVERHRVWVWERERALSRAWQRCQIVYLCATVCACVLIARALRLIYTIIANLTSVVLLNAYWLNESEAWMKCDSFWSQSIYPYIYVCRY